MMMPASFSVIAENEMTYLEGGASALETLGSNIVTLIGNTFVSKLIGATLGAMFGGNWGDGATIFGSLGEIVTGGTTDGKNNYTILNSVMQVIGLAAGVYQLSTVTAPTYIAKKAPLYISGTTTNPLS